MTELGEKSDVEIKNQAPEVILLAIFASGGGSNAAQIINHFKNHSKIKVALVVTNKVGAGVVKIAETECIPVLLLDRERFYTGDGFSALLKEKGIQFIVLAGFLWKVPTTLINAYKSKIVNIHPALLPKFGGKGMYGHHVHGAVIKEGEKESGITIHYVDELYDHGAIIFQATCPVLPGDTAPSLGQRVLSLEHLHYPVVIERVVQQKALFK